MHLILLSLFAVALAQDAETAPAEDVAAPAEEAPAEDPGPPEVRNADFSLTVTHANGTTSKGKVKRVERGIDTHAEKGWTTEEKDLMFYVEGTGEYKKIAWSEVKSVSVKVKDAKDFSCAYSSDYSPWMYECSVKLTSTVSTKNGKRYTADSGHRWRMVFEDDTAAEFWLKRHYAREQEENSDDLDSIGQENIQLYARLQDQLRTEMKGEMVSGLRF